MKNSVDPKDVKKLFNEAIDIADNLHRNFVDAAQSIGYSRDVLLRSKDLVSCKSLKGQPIPT